MSDFNELNVGPRWYVVHTYTGYENKVKATIEKTGVKLIGCILNEVHRGTGKYYHYYKYKKYY